MEQHEVLQITGTVEDVIYRNDENSYTVIDIDVNGKLITATGINLPLTSISITV